MNLDFEFSDKQTLFERAIDSHPYTLYGGAKGGGKSHGLRLIMLLRRLRYPNSVGYIFRQTFPELERNHISPLFKQFPGLRPYYNEGKKTLSLPNGSQLRFAFVQRRNDLQKFQGLDAHDLAIEEAGEWPFDHFEYLDTQKRSALKGIPARTLLTGNPGGIGHQWLKRLFVTKQYRGAENPSNYKFIPALVEDNPFLMENDPDYVNRLNAIRSETLRKAFRYGDWDVQAGQFFQEFTREIHVVKPFDIPQHWKRFYAYDFGFNHPAGIICFACDEDGNVFVYREYAKAQATLKDQAEYIRSWPDYKQFPPGFAGHDCWAKKFAASFDKSNPDQGPTIAESFQAMGVYLTQANIHRIQGANQVREYLNFETKENKRIGPRLFFFSTCELTIDCISRMAHDPDNVEDVLKVDADAGDPFTGDDLYDTLRYGLMSRPLLTKPIKKEPADRWRRQNREISSTSWRTA